MARRKQPVIPHAVLDQLLAGADAKTAFDKDGLLDELKKALAERALNAEMDHHLDAGEGDGNRRTGCLPLTRRSSSSVSSFSLASACTRHRPMLRSPPTCRLRSSNTCGKSVLCRSDCGPNEGVAEWQGGLGQPSPVIRRMFARVPHPHSARCAMATGARADFGNRVRG
jgi:hypothetical protein